MKRKPRTAKASAASKVRQKNDETLSEMTPSQTVPESRGAVHQGDKMPEMPPARNVASGLDDTKKIPKKRRRKSDTTEANIIAAKSLMAAAKAMDKVGTLASPDNNAAQSTPQKHTAKINSGNRNRSGLSGGAETETKTTDDAIAELTAFYEKKIYDLEQMLDISRSFSREIELGKLLEAIRYMCMAQMHVLSVDIFIRGGFDEADDNTLSNKELGLEIKTNHPLVKELFKERLAMTAEGLLSRVPPGVPSPVLNMLKPTLVVPIVDKNTLGGIIFLGERISFEDSAGRDEKPCQCQSATYSDYERSQVMSIATLAAVAISNASLVEKSSTDMMTRLKLKYYFFNILGDRLCEAMERKRTLSVLMFDIDHFKKFNDTYGHECGDYVLITVASLIKKTLRDSDLASRYGGEEFTVLLDNTGRDEAMAIAERIRLAVEQEKFYFNEKELHVTISGGVAVFDARFNPCIEGKELVDQADQGLYMSKHNGRNSVTYADPVLLR